MNSRKLTRYVILIFTILLADIIKEIVLHYIGIEKNHHRPYLSAAVGMGIIVLYFTLCLPSWKKYWKTLLKVM